MYVVLDNDMSVAGRVRVPGLTDRTDGVDTNVLVRAQVGLPEGPELAAMLDKFQFAVDGWNDDSNCRST